MENFNLWRVMEATLEADNTGNAQNSNLNNGNRRSRLALPPVTVFSRLILQQLMVISVFTISFNMVQFVCQGCLLIRSKRLSISLLNSCAVCWTFLIVVLVTRWLFILNRNQTEIMYKGKMLLVGSQLLSVLNLISTFVAFCLEALENSTVAWSFPLFKGLPHFLSQTINNDIKWLMSSMICCNFLNIVLFIIILFYIRRSRLHYNHVMNAWLWRAIFQHIQNNAAQLNVANSNGNALASDYILRTFNQNPSSLLSKDLKYSAPAA